MDFLVRYGFGESSVAGEMFRVIADCPSPGDAANVLRSVAERVF